MQILRDLDALRAARAARGPLALVPTMGALHEGHLSLVAAAQATGLPVITSIFVNPLQFGPNEDLSRYPRDEAGDLAKLDAAGCDLVWLPSVAAMYPEGRATSIEVAGPAEGWEGAARPGHFRGVATVCAKLFLQTGAAVAVFGEKDWQQYQVIRRMVADLDLPLRILGGETVREADGLAMSSRNRFLGPQERALAPRLHQAMQAAAAAMAAGTAPAAALAEARAGLAALGFGVDYLALVEPETLRETTARPGRLIAAARLGSVRLLDNIAAG
ncbi:pantoate--beta-alanine ligase [Siccirubricoccus sp. KC 17139]|uniref:Pantothenate synthetase n=1 Tax=Siccirubricoccus soli TaxID=2899147 RepID=A0ABT1DB16_9PROT|nr:pantoate--beta-alanine ligase [Siccirubricoccus soli]MCO6418170.1 pantoate--beta-alanine ligase [Siccirubricoccus soli]MCP2684305.1 pantoate--beta-alanine ligase [Siccirubricoccus soli]